LIASAILRLCSSDFFLPVFPFPALL